MIGIMANKRRVAEDVSFEDAIEAMKLRANEVNFKLVGESRLWLDVRAISGDENTPRVEIFHFCDAMVAIRKEIDRVAAGEWAVEDSPLRHAPHTAEELIGEWDRPYSRELGAFPDAGLRVAKYFPPVGRIDNAYGDRNLVCSCEPLEALAADPSPVAGQ